MWRGLAPPIKSESENMKTINELHTMLERLILCGHADSEFALIDKTSEDYRGVEGLIIMVKDIEPEEGKALHYENHDHKAVHAEVIEMEGDEIETEIEVIFESEMYK